MNQIKLVVCDLDGTLLNNRKCISDYSIRVLEKVQERGIRICFASGRNIQMMTVYDKKVGGCDFLLSDNGAYVVDKKGKIVFNKYLNKKDAADILQYLNVNALDFTMYTPEAVYVSEGGEKLKKRIISYEVLAKREGYPVKLPVTELSRLCHVDGYENITKIVLYEENPEQKEAYTKFINTLPDVCCEATGYGMTGTFQSRVSKQTALKKVMQDLGIHNRQVCVFGDFDNDLSMFNCAGYRVCMENGSEGLKRAATHAALNNDRDGVARFLAEKLEIIIN